MMFGKLRRRSAGFSLIEIAIAIVVVGLMTSFAIKGKELIRTTKLRSVMDQVNSFRLATQSFLDKYGAMPGDMPNASETFGTSVTNGDGSGNILSLEDAKRFWQHLMASELLSLEFGAALPISKIGGYYTVSTNVAGYSGTWIILSGGTTNNKDFNGIISQEDAYFIDRNYDNGNPSSGDIQTVKASGNTSIGQKYDPKEKNKDCIIMFKIW